MSRTAAFSVGLVLAFLATCQGPPEQLAVEPPPPVPQEHYVQVVAHPDDDLLFMNPDLAEGMRSGRPTTSIYLTAGEADMPDKAGYSAGRQEGTRAAYAQMLGKPNDWSRATIPVGRGRLAEVDTLRADPDVRLVLLNLPEDANAQQGRHALTRLRQDPALTVTTTVPAGAAVGYPQQFDRRAVVESLTALLDAFQPTVIRLQDDQPDHRYQSNWVGVHNHPDHVAGAALAEEAISAHRPRAFSPMVLTYRDYNVGDTPSPLSQADKTTTREAFAAYVGHDALARGDVYRSWTDNSAYRWPRRGKWAIMTEGGGAQAFAVRAHGIARWVRTPGGAWNDPELLPLPEPLRPQVSLLGQGRGKPVLVAQSEDGARILFLRQGSADVRSRRWEVVDAPAGIENGAPAATADSEGRIVLAVKNSAGGVSVRRESAPGRWRPWVELGARDVQDGLSLVAGRDGVVQLFAATRGEVLHWEIPRTGATRGEQVPIGAARPAGAPVAEHARDGSIRLLVRTDRGGELVERTSLPAGGWSGRTTLPASGGIGDPTVTDPGSRGSADLIRVSRDAAGRVRVADRAGGPRLDLGGAVTDHPATLVEPNGDITLVGVGFDGVLVVNTGARGPEGLRFAGWRPAVSPPDAADVRAD